MDAPDDIPFLPPMPDAGPPARPRTHLRAVPPVRIARRGSRFVIVCAIAIAAAAALIGATLFALRVHRQRLADAAFQEAESAYSDGQFGKAARSYDVFTTEFPKDERVARANRRTEFCKLYRVVLDETAAAETVLAALDAFSRDHELADPEKPDWDSILTALCKTCREQLERAGRTLATADFNRAHAYLRWLKTHSNLSIAESIASLEALDADLTKHAGTRASRARFQTVGDTATVSFSATSFADAMRAYAELDTETRDAAETTELLDKLRAAARARISFAPPPENNAAKSPPPVPIEPVAAYRTLARRREIRPTRLESRESVLVRDKDLVTALDPSNGAIRWVVRVGYDAGMPQATVLAGKPVVLLDWQHVGTAALSLCDAGNAAAVWTWQSPAPLVGTVVVRESVFALTQPGQIWRIRLETGLPVQVAQLPEPIDGPPTVRSDQRGLCVVGEHFGTYLFDVNAESAECREVLLLVRRPDAVNSRAVWTPPYLAVFENDLVGRCVLRVLHDEGQQLKMVNTRELDGRVWQAPAIDGPDLFFVTDRWREYCFGLHPTNPSVNLYPTATGKRSSDGSQPDRPQFTHVEQLPFASLTDALRGLELNRTNGEFVERWAHPLADPAARGIQPLQSVAGLVVATLSIPGRDGALVQAVRASNGELMWETRIGAAARDLQLFHATGQPSRLLVRDADTQLAMLAGGPTSDVERWDGPPATSNVLSTSRGDAIIYGTADGTQIRVVNAATRTEAMLLREPVPIASDLLLHEGTLEIAVADTSPATVESPTGQWLTFLTADRSVEVRRFDQPDFVINGAKLPQETSGPIELWYPPIIFQQRLVLLASSAGLDRFELQRSPEGIRYLKRTGRREELPAPFAAPLVRGTGLVWVGRNGHCRLVDPISFRLSDAWEAPGQVRAMAADQQRLYLTLADGSCTGLAFGGQRFARVWHRKIDEPDSEVVGAASWENGSGTAETTVLLATSRGRVLGLAGDTGATRWTIDAPAPLAQPPQILGDSLVVATIDGGLFLIPLPKPGSEKLP